MSIDFSVSGKTVIITGGRGGIGRAIAEGFAQSGAKVVSTDVSPIGDDATAGIDEQMLDVTDKAAVAEFAAGFESVDCLIQCAGMARPFEENDPEVFEQIVGIHLFGAYSLAAALKPALAAAKGSVINVASMFSYFGSPLVPGYGAAKAAIVQLTKTLAVGWAEDGIRVNAIAPGWIATPMTSALDELPDVKAFVMSRLPSGELGQPADLAGPCLFLASDAARLVTGATLTVDGGYSSM